MEALELRRMLERTKMTHEELAETIGVDRRTVGRWALGETPISKCASIAIRAIIHHKEHGCQVKDGPGPCLLSAD